MQILQYPSLNKQNKVESSLWYWDENPYSSWLIIWLIYKSFQRIGCLLFFLLLALTLYNHFWETCILIINPKKGEPSPYILPYFDVFVQLKVLIISMFHYRSRLNDMFYTKDQQVIDDIRLVFSNCYSVRTGFTSRKFLFWFKIFCSSKIFFRSTTWRMQRSMNVRKD